MKYILILFLLIIPFMSKGQLGGKGRLISDVLDPSVINPQTFYALQYKDIAGSPYVEDKAYPGVVILKDGTRVEDQLLRYNGYEDAVLYEMENEVAALIDPELISGFEYQKDKKKVVFISTVLFEDRKNFFEVIYEGKVSLYIHHQITLSKKTDNTGGYGSKDLHGSAFRQYDRYVFVNEAGVTSEVKLSRKSFLGVIDDHTSVLEDYIKENKLKFREHEDLMKLLTYYDTL